jgi:hypothetical protein
MKNIRLMTRQPSGLFDRRYEVAGASPQRRSASGVLEEYPQHPGDGEDNQAVGDIQKKNQISPGKCLQHSMVFLDFPVQSRQ